MDVWSLAPSGDAAKINDEDTWRLSFLTILVSLQLGQKATKKQRGYSGTASTFSHFTRRGMTPDPISANPRYGRLIWVNSAEPRSWCGPAIGILTAEPGPDTADV